MNFMVMQKLTKRKSIENHIYIERVLHERDVSELYGIIHNPETSPEDLCPVKDAAVKIGHAGILQSYWEITGTPISRSNQLKALKNAVPLRGVSIDDERTSVGWLYTGVFGKDYEKMIFQVGGGQNGFVPVMHYSAFAPEDRELINAQILVQKGIWNPKEVSIYFKNKYPQKNKEA